MFVVVFGRSIFFFGVKIFKLVEFRVMGIGSKNFFRGLLGVIVSGIISFFIF